MNSLETSSSRLIFGELDVMNYTRLWLDVFLFRDMNLVIYYPRMHLVGDFLQLDSKTEEKMKFIFARFEMPIFSLHFRNAKEPAIRKFFTFLM